LIITTPVLSTRELRALVNLRPLLAWLKQPYEEHEPPAPDTLLLDGSMAPESLAWTVNAVFRLVRV
jgi:hypothetical protein